MGGPQCSLGDHPTPCEKTNLQIHMAENITFPRLKDLPIVDFVHSCDVNRSLSVFIVTFERIIIGSQTIIVAVVVVVLFFITVVARIPTTTVAVAVIL